jgi:hypothetical protein
VIYIILESHARYKDPQSQVLWELIDKVCTLQPQLSSAAIGFPEIYAVARLVDQAWRKREGSNDLTENERQSSLQITKPSCVTRFEKALGIENSTTEANGVGDQEGLDKELHEMEEFDFDLIDWSFWENGAAFSN